MSKLPSDTHPHKAASAFGWNFLGGRNDLSKKYRIDLCCPSLSHLNACQDERLVVCPKV
jgi:hypothetical protein